MIIWVATGNQGKLKEIQQLFDGTGAEIHHQGEISAFTPRPENGKDFAENAMIKVRSLASIKNTDWVIGEDSGLIVEGLGGLPGVHSARYAGEKATDAENTAKLLKMMQLRCNLQRQARFHCHLVAKSPSGDFFNFTGELVGEISAQQRGSEGFGYDPVFVPDGEEKTLAELGPAYKLKHSHRSVAIRKFIAEGHL